MKTYKNLYKELCSLKNLEKAFRKSKKRKSKMLYVKEFEANLQNELIKLNQELESQTYKPRSLRRFIIRDPKTRTIHSSAFRDRVVHHALINIIGPIFEKRFIHDSYASRIGKGTHNAILRFDKFKRKVSKNNARSCFVLKADVKHYFETVDHKNLLDIIKKRIKDKKVIWLIETILSNFNQKIKDKGMPLGNLTSQFFANVYLNELDYFAKHKLKAKYYLRYVDDFVILHKNKNVLIRYKEKIKDFLNRNLKLTLHPGKSKIVHLTNGISLLGYRIFYYYRLLRKTNKRKFDKNFSEKLSLFKEGLITYENLISSLTGWFGYAIWANTHKLRNNVLELVNNYYPASATLPKAL